MRKLLLLFLFPIPLFTIGQITFPNSSKQQGKKLFMGDTKNVRSVQFGMNGLQIDSLKLVNGQYVIYKAGIAYDPAIGDTLEISSYVPMLVDSNKTNGSGYATPKYVLDNAGVGVVTSITAGVGINIAGTAAIPVVKIDTADVSILSRQRAVNMYQAQGSYLAAGDTATMLAHYAKITAVNLRLAIADTSTMLVPYARKRNPVFTGTHATTGGIIDLNVSSNFATNINTGSSTGTVIVGGTGIMQMDIGASTGVKTINIGTHATPINVIHIGGTNSLITGYGTWTLPSTTSIGNVSSTELGYVDGVTSAIQTQLTGKINKLDSSIVAKNGGYPSSKMFADNLALQIHKADSSAIAKANSYATGKMLADGLALKVAKATMPTIIGIACSDETTALTASTSVAKVTFRMPYAMTVTAVRASVTTAPTNATILVDIHESGTTILSTKIMIDATELTSTTAATGYVIADATLADDASITLFADQIGSTVAGAGLKIWIEGTRVAP